ncbi:hypothetical protein [Reyranella sp.]|uniref:hypothetical protein n=1 Tax=Reyranella sp. TaxID=1929291 RepID=UPI0025F61FAE|nr:hypothetical protein [Reyranella sp.]
MLCHDIKLIDIGRLIISEASLRLGHLKLLKSEFRCLKFARECCHASALHQLLGYDAGCFGLQLPCLHLRLHPLNFNGRAFNLAVKSVALDLRLCRLLPLEVELGSNRATRNFIPSTSDVFARASAFLMVAWASLMRVSAAVLSDAL